MKNLLNPIEVGDILDVAGNAYFLGFRGELEVIAKAENSRVLDWNVPEDISTGIGTAFIGRYVKDDPSGEWSVGERIKFDIGTLNVEATRFVNKSELNENG